MKAVVQYLAWQNGLVQVGETGIMLDQAGPNAIGTVAGSPIVTPAAQIEYGDSPRPNFMVNKIHADNTFAHDAATYNIAVETFPNTNNPNRGDSTCTLGWNAAAGSRENLSIPVASAIVQEHGFAPSLLPVPAAPVLNTATTGGTIANGTYKVEITYTIASSNGETTASSSTTITTTGTNASTITITSPGAAGNVRTDGKGSATGWYAYVTQAGGNTFTRQQAIGSPTAIGTNLVLTAPPTSSGAQPPATNTAAITNDEMYFQYLDSNNVGHRPINTFFDWDSFFTSVSMTVDSLTLLRSDTGAQFVQFLPTVVFLGSAAAGGCTLYFVVNNITAIQQQNAGGTAGVELIRLDSSNVIQLGGGPAPPIGTRINIGFGLGVAPVGRQTITGALSLVTDANAKAVLTSVINALVAFGLATNSTT